MAIVKKSSKKTISKKVSKPKNKTAVKKVSKPKNKTAVVKAKPKKTVAKMKPQWIINMVHKAIEEKPLAELPPPIPLSLVNVEDPSKQLSLPLSLPEEILNPTTSPVLAAEPMVRKVIPPVKKTVAKPIQVKKVYTNIDLVKSVADKVLGGLIKTVLGSLAVGGFIGLLQFCTKLSETGMPLKNIVIFTITSYLVGTLLD